MAAPPYVVATAQAAPVYGSPPRRAEPWRAVRPGEVVGTEVPSGPGFGHQGPDQGYLLKLAADFEDQIMLGPGEHAGDVLAGCCAVALRRASLFARAPVVHDLRHALELFGYLRPAGDEDPAAHEAPAADEQVAWRRPRFAGAAGHHGYHSRMRLAESVPEATLRLTPAAVARARSQDWRALLGL